MLKDFTLLLVDEDPLIHELLKTCLSNKCALLFSVNREQAIKLIKTNQIDLILSDINFAMCDGFNIIEFAKNIDKKLEVIIISAVKEARAAVTAIKQGAYDYVVKPFDKKELNLILDNFFKTAGSIAKCNTWESRKGNAILSGYAEKRICSSVFV